LSFLIGTVGGGTMDAGSGAYRCDNEHFTAVGTCRVLLEYSVQNYITDHNCYINNTKNPKCHYKFPNRLNVNVSDALDHMVKCEGKLDSWKFFSKNSKLCTSAPGKSLYKSLSEYIHTQMSAKENIVKIPEWLEPIEKRFLLRLFKVRGYQVRVIGTAGEVRDPTEHELVTSPEVSPVKLNKSKNKRNTEDNEVAIGASNEIEEKKKKRKNQILG
jgi:hypothetical protein